ncbi:hypothetical protein ACS0OT_07205 [Stenotrophomonas maltophilia group sp. RY12688]|uniref:hypothetical protein n=1 Tax=Stenotrophomonas maltophilia group sp. RY12688 TaxID=3454438 RepID=UPI003F999E09
MDKTFEVELVRASEGTDEQSVVTIERREDEVWLSSASGLLTLMIALLPSEAVTIGEQLIAAGKAEV